MAWAVAGNIRGPQGTQGAPGTPGTPGADGAPGPQGIQGPAGPAGAQYRGIYAAGTTYNEHDVVTQSGASWIVPTGTITLGPGVNPNPSGDGHTAAGGWQLFAAEGAVGPQGSPGTPGAPGAPGARGSQWFTGSGAPGTVAGALPGDQYLDLTSGDVYTLS